MNTTVHKGTNHIFTNNSKTGIIHLTAGPGETLSINGSTAISNNLELIKDLVAIDTSPDIQSASRDFNGIACSIGENWIASGTSDKLDLYRKTGEYWNFYEHTDSEFSSAMGEIYALDVYDRTGTNCVASIQNSITFGGAVSFCEFNGSNWNAATYAGDYGFTTSQPLRSIALMENTCFAIADNEKYIFKSVRVDGVWQKWTAVDFPAFPYPHQIRCNGVDKLCVSYLSGNYIRFFDLNLNIIQTWQDFLGEAGFAKSIDFRDKWLALCNNKSVWIYHYGTLFSHTFQFDYYDVSGTLTHVCIDKKDAKYVVVHNSNNEQYFLVRDTRESDLWSKQSTSAKYRKMTFDSTYPSIANSSAYGNYYVTGAESIESIFIQPLIIYEGLTTVGKVSIDTTDYSVDISSMNEINMVVNESAKLSIDYESINIKEKLAFLQTNNTQEVALQNNSIDQMAATIGGVTKLRITPTENVSEQPLRIQQGSASNAGLTFENDNNTGIFQGTADSISFTTAGVNILNMNSSVINSNKPFVVPQSSSGFPTYTFAGDTDTGIFQNNTGKIDFSSNGTHFASFGNGESLFNQKVTINHNVLQMYQQVNNDTGPIYITKSGLYIIGGGCPNSVSYGTRVRMSTSIFSGGTQIFVLFTSGIADVVTCNAVVYFTITGSFNRHNIHLTGASDNLSHGTSGGYYELSARDYNGSFSYGNYNMVLLVSTPL